MNRDYDPDIELARVIADTEPTSNPVAAARVRRLMRDDASPRQVASTLRASCHTARMFGRPKVTVDEMAKSGDPPQSTQFDAVADRLHRTTVALAIVGAALLLGGSAVNYFVLETIHQLNPVLEGNVLTWCSVVATFGGALLRQCTP